MSDQNKFINTYIEIILGSVQELLNTTFQLKTQLKISGDVIASKDNEIATLKSQVENFSNKESNELSSFKSQINNLSAENSQKDYLIREKTETVQRLETELNSYRTKQSHYDSAIKQIIDMKSEVKKRDTIIEEREKEISDLKTQLETEKQKNISVEPIKESKKPKASAKLFDSVEINKTGTTLAQKDDF